MTHKPTPETRKQVEAMASYGVPQKDIGAIFGITFETLAKHYRKELDTACAKANSMIAQRLYQKAIGGDTTSMIFWLKTRARWAETVRQEHSGVDGGPIEHKDVTLSDREIIERYEKSKEA